MAPLIERPTERPARAAFVGALVAALITLPGLGVGTLWDNSETAYGEVAREILLGHDWIVMHFNGLPYFIQPPLYFWLGALCAMIWGPTSFALRFPASLATIALAALTGYAVARQAGTRVGIYASAILSSCLMVAVIGRLAIMDALLNLTVAAAIFWWFRALETGRDRYTVYGSIAAALGFLAKGPVAPVMALLVIVPFFLWNGRHERMYVPSLRAWAVALLAFVAIALPWPLALVSRDHLYPLWKLFGVYTIGRYTGVIENQAGPVWYYLPVLILGFFPWMAFLPMAVVYGLRQLRTSASSPGARLLRLAFCWIVVPFVFFSFAATKLPNYIALEFPALALLTALYFDSVVRRGGTRSAVISAAFVPLTIGLLAIAIAVFMHTNELAAAVTDVVPGLIGLGIAIFVGSLLTAFMVARQSTVGLAPYALTLATLIAIDAMAILLLPTTEAFKPIPKLAAIIDRNRQPDDRVAIQGVAGGNALIFYTKPGVEVLGARRGDGTQSAAADQRLTICSSPRTWLIAPSGQRGQDPTYGRHRQQIAIDGKATLYLYDGPPCSP